ncbi:MAG: prolyl oligopeptidase family serine peptidase [Gammaproteobacteria bacterium]
MITLLCGGLALAALLFMAQAANAQSGASGQAVAKTIEAAPLTADDTLGDLLGYPALAGFAEHTLPWYGRAYDRSLSLGRLGSLLPYHSAVDPGAVLGGLNLLIGNAERGVPVFHEIYTEGERNTNPDLRETGLFFFPGQAGKPFAIIAPGGGFSYIGSVHEGYPYVAEISALGYNAFVVVYRTGHGARAATEDMARAIDYILSGADKLGVARDGYSVWGSSAGARMAASIGSHGVAAFDGGDHPKPAAVLMAYTGHSDLSDNEPPTFVVVGGRDRIVPPQAMERRIADLRAAGTEVEYHLYETVGHGFGAGTGTEAEGWIDDAVAFWERQIIRPE